MRTSEQIFEELRALTDRSDHLQRRERETNAELEIIRSDLGRVGSKRRELLNDLDVQMQREAEARRTGEPAAIPIVLKPTDRHVAYVDPDLESMRRGGSSRTAACSCGWRGPERSTLELAADDAIGHEVGERPASQPLTMVQKLVQGLRILGPDEIGVCDDEIRVYNGKPSEGDRIRLMMLGWGDRRGTWWFEP